jgi:hypothetical protein
LVLVLVVSGCVTFVSPKDRLAIGVVAGNAVEVNRRVQADANLPPWLRAWVADDANSWDYWGRIANNVGPK